MPIVHRCIGCVRLADEKNEIPEGEKGIYVGLGRWRDPELAELEAEMASLHPVDDDGE